MLDLNGIKLSSVATEMDNGKSGIRERYLRLNLIDDALKHGSFVQAEGPCKVAGIWLQQQLCKQICAATSELANQVPAKDTTILLIASSRNDITLRLLLLGYHV